jgi:hypothetical protein
MAGMLGGGSLSLLLQSGALKAPAALENTGLDASIWGILLSAVLFVGFSLILPDKKTDK